MSLLAIVYVGVTLVLSPGQLQQRYFSDELICVWNVTCPSGHALFVNSTSIELESSALSGKPGTSFLLVVITVA